MRYIFILTFIFFYNLSLTQTLERVEPPQWWVGMKNSNLQLLVYGEKIAELSPSIKHKGVKLTRVHQVENPNYLFLDLTIAPNAKTGTLKIDFSKKGEKILSHKYPLKARTPFAAQRRGFDNADVLYLITPDRFANAIEKNDAIEGLKEQPNREFGGGRHGGDIEGIRKNLDYIADLGFTAIWLNPVLENDMEVYSYHGYSTTDFYKVDPRFGTNEDYKKLSEQASKKGVKLIMDMIVNHCGLDHWWMKDLPSEDWINQWENMTFTNHRKSLLQDPYAAESDKKVFTDGWFVETMPDLNQRNRFMAIYLIQNGIWWIEYLGLAGIRMDTYPYPDMDYMTEWTRRVMEEYPNFNVVGEEWYETPTIVAYWQQGKQNPNGYTSSLKSLMDFPVQVSLKNALNAKETWSEGWIDLYEMLAQDFLYAAPNDLVVFPDNHDMKRVYSQLNEDYDLFKLAMAFYMTTRGVPQIYYGTEILMSSSDDHGNIRSDFPGGWKGDAINAFTGEGLTSQQKEAQAFFKKLLNWRKTKTVVHEGKLTHFIPEEGVYVYFRYDDAESIMVILNKNEGDYTLDMSRFAERLENKLTGTDVLSGSTYDVTKTIQLPAKTPLILELK